ncbi:hypothetical protein AOLI_G00139710 [Acnodon oligacanthus]
MQFTLLKNQNKHLLKDYTHLHTVTAHILPNQTEDVYVSSEAQVCVNGNKVCCPLVADCVTAGSGGDSDGPECALAFSHYCDSQRLTLVQEE